MKTGTIASAALVWMSIVAVPGGLVPARAASLSQTAAVKTVDREDADGLTPLMRAAATGDLARTNALLAQGANPNLQNANARVTALMFAAYFGHADIAKALLAKGARRELKDSSGAAAVDWASLAEKSELEKMLTGDGAALNPFLNLGTMPIWLMDKAAGKPPSASPGTHGTD